MADGTMLLMPYVRQSESQLRSLILNGMRETQKHEGRFNTFRLEIIAKTTPQENHWLFGKGSVTG